jgi:para-nitrobenzyl esterase
LSEYVSTYAYEFNDANAPLNFGLIQASFPLGAYHTAEIQYFLNIFGIPAIFTSNQEQLSDTIIGYWAHFATTGDPNFSNAPIWPTYNALSDRNLSLGPPAPTVEADFATDHQCTKFWDLL